MVTNMSEAAPHEIISERFADAGLSDQRFVTVEEGKKECFDHDTRYEQATMVPGMNYGIYANKSDFYIVLDVDEYEGKQDSVPILALDALPDTLEVKSPHVPDEGPGGHRLYKLGGDTPPAALFNSTFGTENPVPSWGEVIVKNKYHVGAGSQLQGCKKDWCDTCGKPEGGRYEIQADREIATVKPDQMIQALNADPEISKTSKPVNVNQSLSDITDNESNVDHSYDYDDELSQEQIEDALTHISSSCDYSDWVEILFAIHDWDDGSSGKRVAKQWSRGPGWDEHSEREIDSLWRSSNPGNGVTLGTLVHRAKQNGWSPPGASLKPQTTGKANNDKTDEPESDSDAGLSITWSDIRKGYHTASQSDDRLAPRYDARQLLKDEDHWRNVEETDHLWVYEHDTGLFVPRGEQLVRNRLVQNLNEQFRSHEANEICTGIKGEPEHQIGEDELGGPPERIACDNGVLKLDTHPPELVDHHPRFGFISTLETEFDPAAECPRFEQFIEETIPEPSDRLKLQEFAGYVLMHWALPYHKAMFLVGPTASGKSTFLDTIRAMIGDSAGCSLTPQQMTEEQFSAAELYESWVNIRNDIPAQTIQNTGQFKEIIAGDPIKAEEKYQDPFMFSPDTKHMFSGNELPEAEESDNSDAFYRRIMLVAFPETIPRSERESDLDQQLQSELPGVLNWALEGLKRLRDSDGFTGDRPPGQTEITWQKWSNSIKRFVEEGLEEAGGNDIAKSEVHGAYQNYCESEGIPARSQHKFSRWINTHTAFEDGRAHIGGSSREHRKRVFKHCQLTEIGREYLERDDST